MSSIQKGVGIAAVCILLFASALLASPPTSAVGICWSNTGGETCVGVLERGCLVYADSDAGGTHDNCFVLEQ